LNSSLSPRCRRESAKAAPPPSTQAVTSDDGGTSARPITSGISLRVRPHAARRTRSGTVNISAPAKSRARTPVGTARWVTGDSSRGTTVVQRSAARTAVPAASADTRRRGSGESPARPASPS
jgi:hypothetical protein